MHGTAEFIDSKRAQSGHGIVDQTVGPKRALQMSDV
jgi:hypothetical protein